jgi:hypothetical protein
MSGKVIRDAVPRQSACQSSAGFAGGNRQHEAAVVKLVEHLPNAGEQRDLRVADKVMIPVTLGKSGMAVGSQGGRDVTDRVELSQADDVARIHLIGRGNPDVEACLLNSPGNERGRIGERPIPVEREQAVAARRFKHRLAARNP